VTTSTSAPRAVGFGWVVDDDSPRKLAAGGPAEFARKLAAGELDACDARSCPTCDLLDEPLACVGVLEPPISAAAEAWLAGRLPTSIDSLPGQLLRQTIKEGAIRGDRGDALRRAGFLAADQPILKNYGPFFRGTTVSTDQIFEAMLCAGDVQPPHALALLVHLGAVAVDDEVPLTQAHGARLSEIVQAPAVRATRVLCTIQLDEDDDASTTQLKRFVRALFAAFVQDTELRLFG
jgi:hypothetical protein